MDIGPLIRAPLSMIDTLTVAREGGMVPEIEDIAGRDQSNENTTILMDISRKETFDPFIYIYRVFSF
jgi:hypothetical protein